MIHPINDFGTGMRPLNWASKLQKAATDVMFSIAVDDPSSVEARLVDLERTVASLRASIAERVKL